MTKQTRLLHKRMAFSLVFLCVFGLILSLTLFAQEKKEDLVLATTTSTKDSGLLNQLLPIFEAEEGIKVKVIAVGTGQAIKTGEMGDCDVILVHARAAEDKFVDDGYGVHRRDVMYNDFILVGPKEDPAHVQGLPILEALQVIAKGKGIFVSRGDDSGTHKKELELWQKAGIKPQGKWYKAVGKGMGDTLVMTNELGAYTLADRGTYAAMKKRLALVSLVYGETALFNPYGVIAVNPQRHPGVNYQGAMAFIEFITSPRAKKVINNYKVNGEQLFIAE